MAAGFIPKRADDDLGGIWKNPRAFLNCFSRGFTGFVEIDVVVHLKSNPDANGVFLEGEVGDDGVGEEVVGVVDNDAVGIADAGASEAEVDDVSPGSPMSADRVDFDPVAHANRSVGDEENSGEDIGESFLGRHADCNAGDAGAGQEGRNLDSVNAQADEEGDEDEDDDVEALEEMNEAVIEIIVSAGSHLLHAPKDDARDDEVDDESSHQKQPGLGPGSERIKEFEHEREPIVARVAWPRHFREVLFRKNL